MEVSSLICVLVTGNEVDSLSMITVIHNLNTKIEAADGISSNLDVFYVFIYLVRYSCILILKKALN